MFQNLEGENRSGKKERENRLGPGAEVQKGRTVAAGAAAATAAPPPRLMRSSS